MTTTETAADWTIDPGTGRSNSSPLFRSLVDEVARLIRDGAAGSVLRPEWVSGKAGLIIAQLAHVHGFAPRDEGPNPLDARLLTMASILREAGNDAGAGEIETSAAFIREAWRGSDDGTIADALGTIGAYAAELAGVIGFNPAAADEADSAAAKEEQS